MLGDLNGLKDINDYYGHNNGDYALKEIVRSINEYLDEEDFIVRLGGDEFLVLVPNLESSESLANKVSLISNIKIPMKDKFATISVGSSIMTDTSQSFEGLIKQADVNMYIEKNDHKTQTRNIKDEKK